MLMAVIIGMILIGIILLIIEILVIPGTTVVGILGTILILGGIFWMYTDFGSSTGNITLILTAIASATAVYYSLKSQAWKKLALNDALEGRAKEIDPEKVKVGDSGVTLSRLYPIGTAMINGLRCEVQASSEYLPENTNIVVTRISGSKIIVKPQIT
jgi:membrane-bound ClpP family serine protease